MVAYSRRVDTLFFGGEPGFGGYIMDDTAGSGGVSGKICLDRRGFMKMLGVGVGAAAAGGCRRVRRRGRSRRGRGGARR